MGNLIKTYLSVLLLVLLVSCSGSDDDLGGGIGGTGGGTDPLPDPVEEIPNLFGAVQKGPFVAGSSVVVLAPDDSGSFTVLLGETSVLTDLGNFELALDYDGPILVTVSGSYFDEVSGEVSAESATLVAFADFDASVDNIVNLNILTTVLGDRIETLFLNNQGQDFLITINNAENTFVESLGEYTDDLDFDSSFSSIDILLNTEDSAKLLAISAGASSLAANNAIENGTTVAEELDALLNMFSEDLADNGGLDEIEVLEELVIEVNDLDKDEIENNLETLATEVSGEGVDVAEPSDIQLYYRIIAFESDSDQQFDFQLNYDELGRMTDVVLDIDNDPELGGQRLVFEYQEDLVYSHSEYLEEGIWTDADDFSKGKYTYENNKLVQYEFHFAEEGEGNPFNVFEYIYDGETLVREDEWLQDDTSEIRTTYTYQYRPDGKIDSIDRVAYYISSPETTYVDEIEYEYNVQGELIKVIEPSQIWDIEIHDVINTISYDELGRINAVHIDNTLEDVDPYTISFVWELGPCVHVGSNSIFKARFFSQCVLP